MTKRSPSDLTDAEWALLEPLVPRPLQVGRRPAHDKRLILDGIFSVVRGGGSWRMLPSDFPAWQTVYHYFRLWRIDGTWERMHTAVRERTRLKAGRQASPSAGIIDSQSVRTSAKGGSGAMTERSG